MRGLALLKTVGELALSAVAAGAGAAPAGAEDGLVAFGVLDESSIRHYDGRGRRRAWKEALTVGRSLRRTRALLADLDEKVRESMVSPLTQRLMSGERALFSTRDAARATHVTSYRTRIALPSHCASLIERHPPTQVQTQSSAVRSCTVHVIHRYSLLSAWIYSTCISLYRLSQNCSSLRSSSSCFKIAASSASAAKPSTRL